MDTEPGSNFDGVLAVTLDDDVLTLRPLGTPEPLDWPKIERISAQCVDLVRRMNNPKVLVDASDLKTCASGLLAILLSAWKAVKDAHGKWAVCGTSERVLDVLRFTQVDTLWEIYPSRDAAYYALVGSGGTPPTAA
jgi:anti-anti-sigma factor